MFKRTVERLLAILLVLMLAIPALAEDMEIIYQPVDENIELSNELELVEEEPETVDSAELDGTAYLLDDGERPEESEIEESGENNPEIESQEKPAEIPEIKDNGELIEGEVSVPEIGQDAKEPSETEADEGDSEYESVKEVIENTENQPEDVEAEDAEGQSEGEDAEGRSEGEDATEESAKDETAQEDENSTSEVSDDPEDSGEWLSTNVEHIDDEIELDTLYEDESAKLMEAGSLLAANTVNYEYLPSILMVGDVYDLTKCLLIDGYEPSDVVSWKSSKKKVVRISKSGMLTALKTGKAKITVRTSDKKKRTISVSVRANSIGGLFPKPSKGEAIALGEAFSIRPKSLRYSGTKLVAEFYLLNGSKKAMKTIRGLNLSVFAGSRTNKITNQYFSKIKVKGKKKGVSTFKVTFSGSGILQNNVHLSDYPASQIYFDLTVPSVDGTVKRGTIPFVATVIPNVPAPVYVSGISLSTGALSLSVGNSTQLAASVQPDNAENKAIIWSSSNSGVASVDGSGRVTAVSAGTATITVTAADGSGVSASCVVTVASADAVVKATSVTLSQSSVTIGVGQTVTITATVNPSNVSDPRLQYAFSNTSISELAEEPTVIGNKSTFAFVIKGVKEGSTKLTLRPYDDNNKTVTCTITVVGQNSILDAPKSVSAVIAEQDGKNAKVTWSSVTNNNGYRVYYSKASTWTSSTAYVTSTKGTTGKELSDIGKGYYFWVAAVDSKGTVGQVSSRCNIPETSVKAVSVSGFSSGSIGTFNPSSTLSISWNKPSNGNGYYQYKVLGLSNKPNLVSSSESGASTIASSSRTTSTSFSVSSSKMSGYSYLKIAIGAEDMAYDKNKSCAWTVFGIKLESLVPTQQFVTFEAIANGVGSDIVGSNDTKPTSTVDGGTIYDQTKYVLSPGQKVKIPFSTDTGATVATGKLRYLSGSTWYTYEVNKKEVSDTTYSFTTSNGKKWGVVYITIPTNIATGTYMIQLWSKNNANEAISARVKIKINSTSLPSTLYIKQSTLKTCTLASAVMMMRARAYLSGSNNWTSITESSTRSTLWLEGTGLYNNKTYSFSGNSITINCVMAENSITSSKLKTLLDQHPEGIVLYVYEKPHAVFLIDYEGDTFYCADPANGYSGSRIKLGDSYMCKYYGWSQENLIAHADAYWYVSSYSISN